MKQIFMFLGLGIILLSSCTPKIIPSISYNSISSRDNKISLQAAGEKQSSFSIPINFDYQSSLSLDDSVVVYKNSPLLISNYKKFSFTPTNKKKYIIRVYSVCDCLGFKKYMFIPKISIFDKKGNEIKTREIENRFDYPQMTSPLSNIKTWQTESVIDDKINIIVLSDNSQLDSKIYKFLILPFFIPVYIKSSLVGDFYLRIEESK